MPRLNPLLASALLFGLAACGGGAALDPSAGYGPNPVLPPPRSSLIPVVRVADIPVLRLSGISKRFGPLKANDAFSFDL